jgi:zinc-binding alcohol dehydrogenase family protein
MKAIICTRPDPKEPARLHEADVAEPSLLPNDLLVKPLAVASNPVDYKICKQVQPDQLPRILGWDAVAEVLDCGSEVIGFRPGDVVWYAGDVNRAGAYTERQAVDHRLVAHAPRSVSQVDAASLPLTSLTAWELLFERFEVSRASQKAKASLLVLGGAGGVGSVLIQLARSLTDLDVVATASRIESARWVTELGANAVLDYRQDWQPQLASASVQGFDYIASLTASDEHLASCVEVLKPFGRFGLIDDPANFDASVFKHKSASIHWELMFTKSLYQTSDMHTQGAILRDVADLVDAGTLRCTRVGSSPALSASALDAALVAHEAGTAMGKHVMRRPSHWN